MSHSINNNCARPSNLLKGYLLKMVMGTSFNMRSSSTSLLLLNGFDRIRLRHDYYDHEILHCSIQIEQYQDSISIHQEKVKAILSEANTLTDYQWLLWSNFKANVHISSNSYQESVAQEVVCQISDVIQSSDTFSFVDLVLSGQSNSRLCFIFNKGFTSCPVQMYITSIFSKNLSMIELCKNAGICEIVFWDAITTDKKILPVENIQIMMDTKS